MSNPNQTPVTNALPEIRNDIQKSFTAAGGAARALNTIFTAQIFPHMVTSQTTSALEHFLETLYREAKTFTKDSSESVAANALLARTKKFCGLVFGASIVKPKGEDECFDLFTVTRYRMTTKEGQKVPEAHEVFGMSLLKDNLPTRNDKAFTMSQSDICTDAHIAWIKKHFETPDVHADPAEKDTASSLIRICDGKAPKLMGLTPHEEMMKAYLDGVAQADKQEEGEVKTAMQKQNADLLAKCQSYTAPSPKSKPEATSGLKIKNSFGPGVAAA